MGRSTATGSNQRGSTMRYLHRAAVSAALAGLLATTALAQAPSRSGRRPSARTSGRAAPPSERGRSYADGAPSPGEGSVLRHKPWPYAPKDSWGFRNPGGVGRVAEYYPPGNTFQNDSPKSTVAQIGNGGQPDRNEQLASQAVGIARYNALQGHIDRYGHPMGFGFGFGFGGGGPF